jgi:hypothetical protein
VVGDHVVLYEVLRETRFQVGHHFVDARPDGVRAIPRRARQVDDCVRREASGDEGPVVDITSGCEPGEQVADGGPVGQQVHRGPQVVLISHVVLLTLQPARCT